MKLRHIFERICTLGQCHMMSAFMGDGSDYLINLLQTSLDCLSCLFLNSFVFHFYHCSAF